MLKAIFYARFDLERGRSVIHQYPAGSIISRPLDGDDASQRLINFSDIAAYIIPPYELCNRAFSICSSGHRVLGFPVSLEDAKYDRNRFTFNVCFVLDEENDARPWYRAVAKTAAFFRALEDEDGLLQAEEKLAGLKWAGDDGYSASDIGIVYPLLKAIVEDLNAYEETCIRTNEFHVLNLRLVRPRPPPPKIRAWDVPLVVRPLPAGEEWTWDLTLKRISSHLNGVNHVQRIAELADVELKLVKRAVRELVYHKRLMLLDLFHFQAIYTPTADLAWFVNDEEMLQECCRYVASEGAQDTPKEISMLNAVTPTAVIALYTSFSPGLIVHDFVLAHEEELSNIDIRRFITFGVIKGLLRRVHKYVMALETSSSAKLSSTQGSSPTKSKPKSNEDAVKEFDRAWKRAALTSGWATPPSDPPPPVPVGVGQRGSHENDGDEDAETLRRYLDGKHCFDEICVAMRLSEKRVVEKLRKGDFGEVILFNK